MKKRLRKKWLKELAATGLMKPHDGLSELPECIQVVALECWRIKKLLPEFGTHKKYLVLNSSVEKILDALAKEGLELEDPEGAEFQEGMTLDVALFEKTPTLASGVRIISETLAPTLYLRDKLVRAAKVIVSVGTRSEQ